MSIILQTINEIGVLNNLRKFDESFPYVIEIENTQRNILIAWNQLNVKTLTNFYILDMVLLKRVSMARNFRKKKQHDAVDYHPSRSPKHFGHERNDRGNCADPTPGVRMCLFLLRHWRGSLIRSSKDYSQIKLQRMSLRR